MNITELLLNFKWRNFTRDYEQLLENSKKPIEELRNQQLAAFRQIMEYARQNVAYYEKNEEYSIDLNSCDDILELLDSLPIINKSIIKKERENFIDHNSYERVYDMTTGGSTGTPFHYKMNYDDLRYSRLLKYRGYSFAGYSIGDSILMLGGGSLIKKNDIVGLLRSKLLNVKEVSSYGIDNHDFEKIHKYLNSTNKVFIYGYASTIYLLAKYFTSKNLIVDKSKVRGVFTTSELLTSSQRSVIEEVFGDIVFDDYGVNDGGASATNAKNIKVFI